MSRQVEIVEVGPRDGLQGEPEILATDVKQEFVRRALAAGIRRIEVASFVNPKRVPQMADAEAVLAGLERPDDASFIGLVLNQRGFERARDAGVTEVGFVVIASDTFNRRNQGVSTEESIAAWQAIAAQAAAAGLKASIMISAAFGCPFEGEIPQSRVVEIARKLDLTHASELALADTIGVAVPAQVSSLISRLKAIAGDISLRCHFHNTRNIGLANAYAAVDAGIDALDASLGGIGGCPFAPAATGNIPTEDLVYMLHRSGIETGISLPGAVAASQWLQDKLARPVPGMLVKAGLFPQETDAQRQVS